MLHMMNFRPKVLRNTADGAQGGAGDAGGASEEFDPWGDSEDQDEDDIQITDDDIADFKNLWQNNSKDKATGDQNGNGNQQQNQQQTQQRDPAAVFDEHFASRNIFSGEKLTAAMAKFQADGDATEFVATIESSLKGAYRSMLRDVHSISQELEQKILTQADQRAQQFHKGSRSLENLVSSLPAASKEEFAPVVREVYGRYLKKGLSDAEATARTEKYFRGLSKAFGGTGESSQSAQNTRRPGRGKPSDSNWDSFFGK